jgi:hypothetical protein
MLCPTNAEVYNIEKINLHTCLFDTMEPRYRISVFGFIANKFFGELFTLKIPRKA